MTQPPRRQTHTTYSVRSSSLFERPHTTHKAHNFSPRILRQLNLTLQSSWATSTTHNYARAVSNFLSFCNKEKVPHDLRFPANEFVLCAFMASHAGQIASSTARNIVSGLKAWHHLHGAEWKGSMRLHLVMNGIKNLTPESSKRPPRPPIDLAMLTTLLNKLDLTSSFDIAVAACATVAFWSQCRLGELLPTSSHSFSLGDFPTRRQLRNPSNPHTSPTLFLPRTKTKRHGEQVVILSQKGITNPIVILQRHLTTNRLSNNSFLFSYRTSLGLHPLTRRRFLKRCNEVWSQSGYPRSTGHSFRIGGTTELLLSGVPPDVVKQLGRWNSDSFLRYWRRLEAIAPLYATNLPQGSKKRKRGE